MEASRDVRLLNGGRVKWLADKREITTALPSYPRTNYTAQAPQSDIRAFRDQILSSLGRNGFTLVDVRSPSELASGRSAAGRTHSGRGQYSLVDGSPRRWHFQTGRRFARVIRRQGHHPRQRGDRLLSHRRTQQPYLGRASLPAGLLQGAQLRWLLVRVGQSDRSPDRKIARGSYDV